MKSRKLHPRNKHQDRYDFNKLKNAEVELTKFIIKNKFTNEETIDFSNTDAVKTLNKSLLKYFYQLKFWDIPTGFLCPPIPGRADYIHYVADCLNETSFNDKIKVLDIGVGANCVYPIIGHAEYGWTFIGTDISNQSLESAQKIIDENDLQSFIELRLQLNIDKIFDGILKDDEVIDFVICNPPFHSSAAEAKAGTLRKNKNLGLKNNLNFGGIQNELWCDGGELEFIRKMILESKNLKNQIRWFSSLVSSKENLSSIYGELKRVGIKEVKTYEMHQGQKVSRFVAWKY